MIKNIDLIWKETFCDYPKSDTNFITEIRKVFIIYRILIFPLLGFVYVNDIFRLTFSSYGYFAMSSDGAVDQPNLSWLPMAFSSISENKCPQVHRVQSWALLSKVGGSSSKLFLSQVAQNKKEEAGNRQIPFSLP